MSGLAKPRQLEESVAEGDGGRTLHHNWEALNPGDHSWLPWGNWSNRLIFLLFNLNILTIFSLCFERTPTHAATIKWVCVMTCRQANSARFRLVTATIAPTNLHRYPNPVQRRAARAAQVRAAAFPEVHLFSTRRTASYPYRRTRLQALTRWNRSRLRKSTKWTSSSSSTRTSVVRRDVRSDVGAATEWQRPSSENCSGWWGARSINSSNTSSSSRLSSWWLSPAALHWWEINM